MLKEERQKAKLKSQTETKLESNASLSSSSSPSSLLQRSDDARGRRETGQNVQTSTDKDKVERLVVDGHELLPMYGYALPRMSEMEDRASEESNKIILDDMQVKGGPAGLYYIDDFLSEVEADTMQKNTYSVDERGWEQLRRRRLQNYGGYAGRYLTSVPGWVDSLFEVMTRRGVFDTDHRPNHLLLNEYKRGEGISAHTDGPAYYPRVAILSLLSPLKICFWRSVSEVAKGGCTTSLLLRPRSLLVFEGEAYNDYVHSIEEVAEDEIDESVLNAKEEEKGRVIKRSLRLSFTIRHAYADTTIPLPASLRRD